MAPTAKVFEFGIFLVDGLSTKLGAAQKGKKILEAEIANRPDAKPASEHPGNQLFRRARRKAGQLTGRWLGRARARPYRRAGAIHGGECAANTRGPGGASPAPTNGKRTTRLVFELDYVGVIVDAHGVEFAENVFAEEAVELGAQELV